MTQMVPSRSWRSDETEMVPRVTVTDQLIEVEIIVPTEGTGQAVPSVGDRVVLRAGGGA